ncbi:hypothetical protein [uncultured Clostridium sp.]|jgi:hypothetical protein|uniref:hypothetical protein n=1 Tax=uncultured Clostridium sp. TaxID=59620 RepID=UPI00260DB1D4|nr:hypothetical protein [uncultured Clostridium sp.]
MIQNFSKYSLSIVKITLNTPTLLDEIKNFQFLAENLRSYDVTKNTYYSKIFFKFCHMNRCTNEVKQIFLNFLEYNKNKSKLSLEASIIDLKIKTNKCQKAYITKMFAIINSDYPILNTPICDKLDIPNISGIKNKNAICTQYLNLQKAYKEFLSTKQCKQWLELFDKKFPTVKISPTKKVDFILWIIP